MSKIRNKCKLIHVIAVVTYKEWAAYRTHSLVSVLVGPLVFLVQLSITRVIFTQNDQIAGMDFAGMIAYFAVSSLISYLTMDFADWNLQMLIHTGKYLTFSLRPLHHRFFALSQKLGHRTLGFLFEFLPVWLIFLFLFRIPLYPASWLWSLLSIALGFLMQFYINYTIGLTGFWLVKTGSLRHIIQILTSLCSGALLPLVFFPTAIQQIIFFLPFQFTLFVPSMVFLGSYRLGHFTLELPHIVGIQALYVVGILLVSELVYRAGMKRFTAVGA